MKLTWQTSGDSLDIEVTSEHLVHHWIDALPSNKFIPKEDNLPYKAVDRLHESIDKINKLFIEKFDIHTFDYEEILLDQSFLNKVHRDWADVQIQHSSLVLLLEKMGEEWLQLFYDINLSFHDIEHECHIKYVQEDSNTLFTHQIEGLTNMEDYLRHGKSQIYLEYWSLGRDDYNAWQHGDTDALISNFGKLPFAFDITLQRPYTSEYPREYVDWMNKQGKKPIGSYLPIGNFKGYRNSVGDLYSIFFRNSKQKIILEC